MKNLLLQLVVAMVATLGLVSCENDSTSSATPTLEVTAISSTDSTISFVINVRAEECAYMLYDGDNIDAQSVLANGTKTDGGMITVESLQPNTNYYVAVAAANGNNTTLKTIMMKTADDNNGGNNGGDNGGNQELPEIDGVENVVITKTKDGRWYERYNFYVTLVRDNGDNIVLDLYTLDETMSSYLPYGQYSLGNTYDPYTLHSESSRYVPVGVDGVDGYYFTDGYVSVDVVNGYYSIYFLLTYDENGTSKSIQGLYNGLLSGAAVPEGDNDGAKELIEVLEVGSTSFQFKINAEEGQYWRCSVVDKRVYDQTESNPGAWVVTYGFMLDGTRTFNWANGEMCEHVPGYMMNVSSSTDYLILAALMDHSEGKENSLLGGVEIVQIHTEAEAAGTGTVDVDIKEINVNDVVFDCTLGENVWCCYVAMMETANIQEIKDGKYALAGYESYEECMLSLIPALSPEYMRQFLESQVDYKWDYLKYGTSYTICIKVVDMNNGVSYIEIEPFTTKQ